MRQDTENCLKKYAVKTLGNKGNIEAVERAVPEDETIIYIAPSNMKVLINLNSTKGIVIGAIAITEKCLYIYNMSTKEITPLPLRQAASADFHAGGLVGSTFRVTFKDLTVLEFSAGYQKDMATLLWSEINQFIGLNNQEDEPTEDSAKTEILDIPAEIRKYKELMDDGIITEKEFIAKKEQLLTQ